MTNIWKRLCTLYKLSGLEYGHSTEILPKGDKVVKLIQKKKMAKIIDLTPPVDIND